MTSQQIQIMKEEQVNVNSCECSICYENVALSDCTITKCGHKFHSSCIFKNLTFRSECPLCRDTLVEEEKEEEEEEEEEEEDDTTNSNGSYSLTLTCEQIAEKLKRKGITPADLVYMIIAGDGFELNRKDIPRYTEEFETNIIDEINKVMDQSEYVEYRDDRSYADVVLKGKPIEEDNEDDSISIEE